MDVSASLSVSTATKPYPSVLNDPASAPAAPASPAADVDAANESYGPSATLTQVAAAITVAPSPTPGEVVAAVQRLPASARYAPSSVPRDATLGAPFDRSA